MVQGSYSSSHDQVHILASENPREAEVHTFLLRAWIRDCTWFMLTFYLLEFSFTVKLQEMLGNVVFILGSHMAP